MLNVVALMGRLVADPERTASLFLSGPKVNGRCRAEQRLRHRDPQYRIHALSPSFMRSLFQPLCPKEDRPLFMHHIISALFSQRQPQRAAAARCTGGSLQKDFLFFS